MKPSPATCQHKSFPFQVKAIDDEQGLIEAYGSVFDNVDEGDDVVKPGAFKRTIQNSKSRMQAGKAKFLAMMLWNHDVAIPIGGWSDLKEDSHGLLCKGQIVLSTQAGKEAYELIKAGVIQEFSIGYEVMPGGANYDSKTGYRNLTELRLWEVSPVTFAMNQEALLVGVKSMDIETKSVHGDTSLPIGPRDASWDGPAAKKQIFSYAEDGDSFDVSKLKKCFLKQDGDPQQKGSWGYPFVNIVNGSPQINVAGVKACAGALSGARNADAGGDTTGMKKKVATMYHRINAKYPDAEPLVPPWEDDGKAMQPRQQKSFMEHYNEEMAEDLLEDLQDVWFTAFCKAVVDAFKIGDMPANDISEALDAFKVQFMKDWVERAVACDMCGYLATDDMDSPLRYYGLYGYMSRQKPLQGKAGRAISASNQSNIDNHVNSLHDMANKMMADMRAHVKAIRTQADDFATVMQGSEPTYAEPNEGTPNDGQQEGKQLALALAELKTLRMK